MATTNLYNPLGTLPEVHVVSSGNMRVPLRFGVNIATEVAGVRSIRLGQVIIGYVTWSQGEPLLLTYTKLNGNTITARLNGVDEVLRELTEMLTADETS